MTEQLGLVEVAEAKEITPAESGEIGGLMELAIREKVSAETLAFSMNLLASFSVTFFNNVSGSDLSSTSPGAHITSRSKGGHRSSSLIRSIIAS